jgi:hypothetical protein
VWKMRRHLPKLSQDQNRVPMSLAQEVGEAEGEQEIGKYIRL